MRLAKTIATFGYIGYLPAAGTVASFVCLPIIALITHNFLSLFLVVASWMFVAALIIVSYALPFFKEKDSKHIVIDEGVGIFFTFISVSPSLFSLIIGFFIFRFFDITKCCGISYVEKLPRAWGVVLDDVVAGILANLCLRAILLAV